MANETNGIIEQYAAHLEAKAAGVVLRLTVLFGLGGAVLGGFPLFYKSHAVVSGHMGYATFMLGAVAGAYLGYTFGDRKALDFRMQARLALHQLQVEQSLIRSVAGARVAAPVAPAVAVPQQVVQQPLVQQPVAQPVPVAPPAPAPVSPPPVVPVAPAPVAPAPVAPAPVAPAPVAPPPVVPVA